MVVRTHILIGKTFEAILLDEKVVPLLDGMHIITILFQSARRKKLAADVLPLSVMTSKLATWEKEWSERDISTFMYGIRSLPCVSKEEFEFLKMAATKISLSKASLSSRAIGNALYGLQELTSDVDGVSQLVEALTDKVRNSMVILPDRTSASLCMVFKGPQPRHLRQCARIDWCICREG